MLDRFLVQLGVFGVIAAAAIAIRIAIAVRDQFHAASLPYVLHGEPATEIVRDKLRLRQLMLDYQNAARADLARGAPLPTSPAPPAFPVRGTGPER